MAKSLSLPPQQSLQMDRQEIPKLTKLLPAMTSEANGGEAQAKNSEAGVPIPQLPIGLWYSRPSSEKGDEWPGNINRDFCYQITRTGPESQKARGRG